MSSPVLAKHALWWCTVLALSILFIFWAYRTGDALYHNHQLRTQFPASTSASPYQQKIPMEQMDLTTYTPLFPMIFTAAGYSLTHRIETPVTLKYYTKIPTDETAVTLEIVKGSTIVAIPEGTKGAPFLEVGYGYTSYPTYERDWRYVRPFHTTEGLDQANNEQFYYIHISSLEAVLDKVIEVNKPFRAEIQQQRWSQEKGKHFLARYIDNALYQNGAYLSPDLVHRVLDRWNTILLSAIGVIIVVFIVIRSTWFRR
ncbi:hypothetical protein [Paenibacillus chungangensis]|uniref:Uncharacterized protein n=1 Tax=Paenibacillus chungangensis TaxID=696535 RepID=A0ABW3HW32_9BACL